MQADVAAEILNVSVAQRVKERRLDTSHALCPPPPKKYIIDLADVLCYHSHTHNFCGMQERSLSLSGHTIMR